MENKTELDLSKAPVKKFPSSFQNLTLLQNFNLCLSPCRKKGCDGIPLLNICMMPELVNITASGREGWLLPKEDEGAEKVSSTVSSNVQYLHLRNCNLSDEIFPIVLPLFVNVKDLDLSENNFTVIPECIKECCFLTTLNLNYCERLREIRGIPPNLKYFTAENCLSLTSSCRSMLLNQELHEAGSTFFYLPGAKILLPEAKIPEWFEFQTSGLPISLWLSNKFPAMAICLVIERVCEYSWSKVDRYRSTFVIPGNFTIIVIINGNKYLFDSFEMGSDYTCIFYLREKKRKNNLDEALLENEWNHADVIYPGFFLSPSFKSGIHVSKQESSREDIRFPDPCRKRKFDYDLNNSSESQNQQFLEKQR